MEDKTWPHDVSVRLLRVFQTLPASFDMPSYLILTCDTPAGPSEKASSRLDNNSDFQIVVFKVY